MAEKTNFKDLSGFLKTTVVLFWVLFGLSALSFLIGFIAGSMGTI